MEKIILKEDFDLVEVYNQLLESRGVIDGIDGIVVTIMGYINKVLSSDELKKMYFREYDKEEDVDEYRFTVPVGLFNNVDTLFMKEPIYNINLFIMRNRFGDTERELGETNYIEEFYPDLINIDNQYYLYKPEFNLSFVVEDKDSIDMFVVSEKVSHELVHAKRNFYEYIRMSKKRKESLQYSSKTIELLSADRKDEIRYLVGRILYLASKDEINARANQLYYELKRYSSINRNNVNKFVEKTNVYRFIKEIDEKITEIENLEKDGNYKIYDYIYNLLKTVYRKKEFKSDPYEFLINLLITRKNYFIRQIDKVKERVLYEKLREPIIMGHYDDFRKK